MKTVSGESVTAGDLFSYEMKEFHMRRANNINDSEHEYGSVPYIVRYAHLTIVHVMVQKASGINSNRSNLELAMESLSRLKNKYLSLWDEDGDVTNLVAGEIFAGAANEIMMYLNR